MINLVMQMFGLWESSNKNNLSEDNHNSLMEDWKKLCLEVEIRLHVASGDKISYLNAIAALSEQIYSIYRKQTNLMYLRKWLADLEGLLKDREQPTKFQVSMLKPTIAGDGKKVIFVLRKFSVAESLINIMEFVFKDIRINFPVSKRLSDYLNVFSYWVTNQTPLTTGQLVERLIQINFNHPQIIEYIIRFYKISELPKTPEEQYKMRKSLMETQRNFEYLNVLSSAGLSLNKSSIGTYLLSSIKVDLKFVQWQMKHELLKNKLKNLLPNLPIITEAQTTMKKPLTKWPSDKSDLVELAYAMYVYMRARGSQITIAMLVKWLEEAFGVSLSRYSHRFAEIKMRKLTRPSKFLDTMVNEFLNYVEDSDAFQPGVIA